MLLIKAIILFLFVFFVIAVIAEVWGGFWAFVFFLILVVQAYEEWTKKIVALLAAPSSALYNFKCRIFEKQSPLAYFKLYIHLLTAMLYILIKLYNYNN